MAVQRRLAAILAADVAGYSRLMGNDEEGTLAALTAHLTELIEPCIADHRGRIVKTTGDGLLAEFASVVDAVRCAISFQEGMLARNSDTHEDRRIEFRIGVNLGDVIIQDNDVYGDGVNVAARLEGLAERGGVIVSGTVREHVRGKLKIQFDDLGPQEVKNIAEPVRAYRVRLDGGSPITYRQSDARPLPDKPSIAVLPFENMSGDPEQEYFSDGITEDLISALARIRAFKVISRNSTFTYRGSAVRIEQAAEELGVRYIVEGSVRKAGERIRVTAQLIEGAKDEHIWADRYDRELSDVFALQDELVTTLAGAIEPALGRAERERARLARPDNLGTWEIYQRAMGRLYQRTHESLTVAEQLFRDAIDRDSDFAPAHCGLAVTCFYQIFTGVPGTSDKTKQTVLSAAQRAVELDVGDADAHCALGRALRLRMEITAAIAEYNSAIRLNPSFAEAHYLLGAILARSSPREGITELQTSIDLSPQDPWLCSRYARMAEAYLLLGEDETALECAQQALRLPNRTFVHHTVLIAALGQLGRIDQARSAIKNLNDFHPGVTQASVRELLSIGGDHMERYFDGLRKAGLPE